MNLINLVKRILNINKEIDTKTLPSQGLFYNDDFKMKNQLKRKKTINKV